MIFLSLPHPPKKGKRKKKTKQFTQKQIRELGKKIKLHNQKNNHKTMREREERETDRQRGEGGRERGVKEQRRGEDGGSGVHLSPPLLHAHLPLSVLHNYIV